MRLAIIICTYNGEKRLRPTLEHLLAQQVANGHDWEVIVVDNASTDLSARVAEQLLKGSGLPHRILSEPLPGKLNALRTGLAHTTAEFVTIADDDNWLGPDWVDTAVALMESHHDVGIFGSFNEPAFEAPSPPWFDRVKSRYACGPQGEPNQPKRFKLVCGAGMTFRRSIWIELQRHRFWFLTDCRRGQKQMAGEDLEFCMAASVLGWKVMYSETLRLRHFLTKERMDWSYFVKLLKSQGRGAIGIDPYLIQNETSSRALAAIKTSWMWQSAAKLKKVVRLMLHAGSFGRTCPEGDLPRAMLALEMACLREVISRNLQYGRYMRQVRRLHSRANGLPAPHA